MSWLVFIINLTWPKLACQEGSSRKALSFSGWPIVSMTLWGKMFPWCMCHSSEAKGSQYMCYSSEGKGMLTAGSWGIPNSHSAQQISHRRCIRKDTKVWLPQLRWQAAGKWAGGKLMYRVSWGLSFPGWGLVGFQAQGVVNFQNPDVSSGFTPTPMGISPWN